MREALFALREGAWYPQPALASESSSEVPGNADSGKPPIYLLDSMANE
jgi:hypothetical protein